MALEIERKYLVTGDEWRNAEGVVLRQGYLSTHPERTVRVRTEGDKAKLTIKGITRGRHPRRVRIRHPARGRRRTAAAVRAAPHREGAPAIGARRPRLGSGRVSSATTRASSSPRLSSIAKTGPLTKPPWVGEEVTHDPRYYNASLVANPFTKWHNPNKRP